MIRYDKYFLMYGMRRANMVNKIFPYYEFNELPVGSVLHLGMCINKSVDRETRPVPNPEDYAHFVTDKLMKFYFETSANTANLVVPFELGSYTPFTSAAINAIKQFRNQTTKIVSSIKEMPFLGGYQGIVSYDPLFCGTITGILRKYRMTTLVLDQMLTHAANNQEYDHFFVFKTENIQFAYTQFNKTFKVHDRISIMNPESAYYILLMNILGFLHSDDTPSLFSRVSKDVLSKINIIIANEDNNTAMHIRLDMLKQFAEKDPFIGKKLLFTLNILSKTEVIPVQDVIPNKEITEVKADVGKGGKDNITTFKEEPTAKETAITIAETIVKQDNAVAKNIADNPNLTPKQKKFNTEVSQEYKKIVIDKKPLAKILTESSDVKLVDSDVADSVHIPDHSMTKSSMTNFSTQYMEKLFGRDLISCLTSFSKLGMYLVDLTKEDVVDDLSELVKYTAKFKDMDGSSHTIKFTFPKIDANGNFMVNGSLKRMGIQRINTPICKVSPTRVSISSCYNKSIVELNESFSNSLSKRLKKIFEKTKLPIKAELGTTHTPGVTLPHEYSTIANEYFSIKGLGLDLTFHYYNRFDKINSAPLLKLEKEFNCVYIGTYKKDPVFMNVDGMLLIKGETPSRLIDLLDTLITDVEFESYNEWVNFVILNKKFPIIFILAYRFGFEHILKYLDVDYEKIPKGAKTNAKTSDILVKTFDVTFVIKNPTTLIRFIVSGINNFNLKEVEHRALEEKDAYYSMLQSRGYSIEYLRGIDTTFDLFIDPITEDTLRQMHEPTNMKDLLIRAVVLLVTSEHQEAASATMFRYRTYEQMNAIMYKTLARAFATYRHKAVGYRNKFSVSEFDVLKAILTDPLVENVDTVNPIGEVKAQLRYTHIGDGGRTKEAMMIPDRRYPKDGMGSISEATVDSGKVGIDGIMSTDPTVVNLRGMVSVKPSKDLTTTNILSPTALLFPGATMDDGKRAK